jgi:uncharacterized protein (DUF302 family)
MDHTINRASSYTLFEARGTRIRKALADKGFGSLTDATVKATRKKKRDEGMSPYLILGACTPKMAFKAIGTEPRVGALLPCNVILRKGDGSVDVSAADPAASIQFIDNAEMVKAAAQLRELRKKTVEII